MQLGSFNSRSREGSDRWVHVSIAPEGGFNSRSREGSDGGQTSLFFDFAFQFTLPRGERPEDTEAQEP